MTEHAPVEMRPLPIHASDPAAVPMEAIKRAKAALDLPFRVRPVDAEQVEGQRVLAFEKPGWICDFFLVSERTPDERMQRALAWVLGDGEDEEAATVVDTLNVVFGGGVREISQAELDSEAAWAAFFAGE